MGTIGYLLLKRYLAYLSPIFEARRVPLRPVEVSCDVMPDLAAYQTAVETRTYSSGMRTALMDVWPAYTSFCLTLVWSA